MRTLQESLEHTPTTLLREMARFWEVPDADEAGRPNLISGLLDQVSRPEQVRLVLRRLDRDERDALRAILAAGGRMRAPTFTHSFGPLRPPNLAPADPAELSTTERLHRKALLFRTFAAWEEWQGLTFFVPVELLPSLPRVPRNQPAELLAPRNPAEVTAIPTTRSIDRDVASLLALLRREAHSLTEDGGWPAALLTALAAILGTTHPAMPSFLLHLARSARLLAPDAEGTLLPTAEGQQWLRAVPAVRAQSLFQAWRESTLWDDLAAVPELLVDRPWPSDYSVPRGHALRLLAACPSQAWLSLSNWLQVVATSEPEFLRPSGAPGRPRLRLRETGALLSEGTAWDEVEGRYLTFLIRGPLHWLGAVDLGYAGGTAKLATTTSATGEEGAADGSASAAALPAEEANVANGVPVFAITPLGNALLHPENALPSMDDEPVIVEGTFEVWAPLASSPYALFTLEEYAELIRRDHVSQYRLTRVALHRALQRGERVDRLVESLERYGRGPVPQNVAYTLREWASSYGRLTLHRPLLLSAADALLLEEVLADTQVQSTCRKRLSPQVIEIEPGQSAALFERLCDLGHLPRAEEGVLPGQDHLDVSLTAGQAANLLGLLLAWEDLLEKGETVRTLAAMAQAIAQSLSPAGLTRARKLKERWLKTLRK